MNKYVQLLLIVVVCQLVGIAGTPYTMISIPTWYDALAKPELLPPNSVFGPVWTTLYFMMGVAMWRVLQKVQNNALRRESIWVFAVQLGINYLWTMIFFGFRQPLLALFVIGLLWVLIVLCIARFWQTSRLAAVLLVPYLLWVSFATYLNLSIVRLN
jgi:tryptophan-rich sensory protein